MFIFKFVGEAIGNSKLEKEERNNHKYWREIKSNRNTFTGRIICKFYSSCRNFLMIFKCGSNAHGVSWGSLEFRCSSEYIFDVTKDGFQTPFLYAHKPAYTLTPSLREHLPFDRTYFVLPCFVTFNKRRSAVWNLQMLFMSAIPLYFFSRKQTATLRWRDCSEPTDHFELISEYKT
jgi:hypothetical protein